MTQIELAKKALDNIQDECFSAYVYASEGGVCGGGWDDSVDLDLSRKQLLSLIRSRVDAPELFEGMTLEDVDVDGLIADMAKEAAWPDGIADEYDSFTYGGESEELEGWLEAWSYIFDSILSGDITEDELDSWLEYFDDSDNYEMEISDWHEEQAEE